MFYAAAHKDSKMLLDSWRAINGLDATKSGLETFENIRHTNADGISSRLFMAQRVAEGVFVFKTVGRELKEWTGRDLRDHEIGSIFYGADKVLLRALLEAAINQPGPALARVAAFGTGLRQRCDIEMVFLPLIEKSGTTRILGLFSPLAANHDIVKPALRFNITALIPPDPALTLRPNLKVVASK